MDGNDALRADLVIELLIASGDLKPERVEQARSIIRSAAVDAATHPDTARLDFIAAHALFIDVEHGDRYDRIAWRDHFPRMRAGRPANLRNALDAARNRL